MLWDVLGEAVRPCIQLVAISVNNCFRYYVPAVNEFLKSAEKAKVAGTLGDFLNEQAVLAKKLSGVSVYALGVKSRS